MHYSEESFWLAFNKDMQRFMKNWVTLPAVYAEFSRLLAQMYQRMGQQWAYSSSIQG